MMKIFFLTFRIILFIALVVPTLKYLSERYEFASSQNHINEWNRNRVADFYALEDNSLDMVFIGSSHSYCTFAPSLIDPDLGIESFQFGMPLAHADTNYFILQEILKTQSPQFVILELYWDVLDDDFEIKQADTFFQAFNNQKLQLFYIEELFPWNEKIKYKIPLIRYQSDFINYQNKRLNDWLDFKKESSKQEGVEYYEYRGFMFCDYVINLEDKNQYERFDGKNWAFSSVQQSYLEKIINTCEENDLDLIFVTAPVAPVSMEKIENYNIVHQAINDFSLKNDTPYLDFNIVNEQDRILANENFRDEAHVNFSGAEIVNEYFVRWLYPRVISEK
jgi:hypothetical protein